MAWIRMTGSSKGTGGIKKLYTNGIQDVAWDNRGYANATTYTSDGGWTLNNDSLSCPTVFTNGHNRAFVTNSKISLEGYSKLKASYNGGVAELDISDINADAYIVLNGARSVGGIQLFGILVTREKANFGTSGNYYKYNNTENITFPIVVDKVWLEK